MARVTKIPRHIRRPSLDPAAAGCAKITDNKRTIPVLPHRIHDYS